MKFSFSCLGTLVLSSFLILPGQSLAQQPVGIVTALKGSAQLTRAATQTALAFRDDVILRDIIDTQERSLVRILFGGKSTVTVRELTRLEVREEILPTGARRSIHELTLGAILINVARELMQPGDEVLIRTPNAVAAVRGTNIFTQCIIVETVTRLLQCAFTVLTGSAIITPQGLPPITLAPNTSVNIKGTPGIGVERGPIQPVTPDGAKEIVDGFDVKSGPAGGESEPNLEQKGESNQGELKVVMDVALGGGDVDVEITYEPPAFDENKVNEKSQDVKNQPGNDNPGANSGPLIAGGPAEVPDRTQPDELTEDTTMESGIITQDPLFRISGTVNGTSNLIHVPSGVDVTFVGQLLDVTSGSNVTTGENLFLYEGTVTGQGTKPFIQTNASTFSLRNVVRGANGSLTLSGPLLKATQSEITADNEDANRNDHLLVLRDSATLTGPTNGSALFSFDDNSTLTANGNGISIRRSTTPETPTTLKLGGPLLIAKNSTITGNTIVSLSESAKLEGNGTDALIQSDSSSFNTARPFFRLRETCTNCPNPGTPGPATVTLAGPLLNASSSTFTLGDVNFSALLDIRDGSSLTGPAKPSSGDAPALVTFNQSTLKTSTPVTSAATIFFNVSLNGELKLGGPVLEATGSTFSTNANFARVTQEGVLNGDGETALFKFTNSILNIGSDTVETDGGEPFDNFFLVDDSTSTTVTGPATVTLKGALVDDSGSTFNIADDFLRVIDGSTFESTTPDPLIKFSGSILDVDDAFARIDDNAKVTLSGSLLNDTGSTLTMPRFLRVERGGTLTSTDANPLITLNGSTINTDQEFLRVQDDGSKIELSGSLLNDTGNTLTTNRFVRVRRGGTFISTGTDSLITLNGSTINTDQEFLRVQDNGSKIELSGSFLTAGTESTLNIATDPAGFGDLLDIRGGDKFVMNSADPVVLLDGGTHTIGTSDTTTNDTPNRIFRISGVNKDAVTGLGTDQPIKGSGTFTNDWGADPTNAVGTLLKATGGATIEVKRGAGDGTPPPADPAPGGRAVRLDTVLYEATLPAIELIGTNPQTTLTTAMDTIHLRDTKAVTMGPVIALDNGLIKVTEGALISLRTGSNWDVSGDLLKLLNGSTINVVNGPLIRVTGTSGTGTASRLRVSGALVNFGGSGNNKIIINNTLCPAACTVKSGIQVLEGTAGSITIGPNPIKNSGLGSFEFNTKIPSPGPANRAAVIQTDVNGVVNITAP